MVEQSSIVFCIDAPLLDWQEVQDRNDSFIYQAKRLSKIASTSLVLLGDAGLKGTTYPTTIQDTNLNLFIECDDKAFLKCIKSLKPDTIIHLGSLQRPFNKIMAQEFPKTTKILFWAGGEMQDNNVNYFDHIAVHHPWQTSLFAEVNGIDQSLVSDIQGGVDLKMFAPSEEIERKTRGFYPSNILPPKRQHLAALALDLVDMPLLLSGYVIDDAYANYLTQFGQVTVKPRIPHNKIAKEYIASMIAPITTPVEAGPHVLIEAMACETIPIVTADCLSTSNVAAQAGLKDLIAEPTYIDIADKVNIALADCEHYASNLRPFVEQYYDLDKKFNRLQMLIKELS